MTQMPLIIGGAPERGSASSLLIDGRDQTASPASGQPSIPFRGEDPSGTATPTSIDETQPRHMASLSHILTNAIILQEFILEIAAIVQLRATFFDEVNLKSEIKE
jgi:hypothetical protein